MTTTATPDQVQFMAENPIMDAPPGWSLDPSLIQPDDGDVTTPNAWYVTDATGTVLHQIDELPDGAERPALLLLAQADARAARIELWRKVGEPDGGCWWAANRS